MLNQAINSTVNSPITISDFVVLIREKSSGEFGIHTADEKTQLNRLFAAIEKLALAAESEHLEANFSNGTLLSDRQNHITRLITNEFLFYTKVPLTLFEFDILRKKIESLAESLPSNLHLILSSFAVRTSEGKIMNVVLHVECGAHPQIRSIVKNNSSIIDPVYSENLNGSWVVLPYVKADTDRLPSGFSFDTFLISETEGKSKMVNCIEICFDHGLGVAKKKLDQMFYEKETISNELDESKKREASMNIEAFPLQCSHVVTSNCIKRSPENILGSLSHADPALPPDTQDCSKPIFLYNDLGFGVPVNAHVTKPIACGLLPQKKLDAIKSMHESLGMQTSLLASSLEKLESSINCPLLFAVRNGNAADCIKLIDQGEDPYALERYGINILHFAVQNGYLELCKVLIVQAPKLNNSNRYRINALHVAAENGHHTVCQALIDAGMNIDTSTLSGALQLAAQKGYVDVCKVLIEAGANVDAFAGWGMNALQLAAEKGHVEVCRALIEAGADTKVLNSHGMDALHLAAQNGWVEVCKALIDEGMSVDTFTSYGMNALHIAAQNGRVEVCKALIEKGADANASDSKNGKNALHFAAEMGHVEVCRELIARGVRLNALDDYGANALHWAALNDHADVCRALIESGADLNAFVLSNGMNPLHCAAEKGHVEVCRALIEAGADLKAFNSHGLDALHIAAQNGRVEVCKALIEKGADVNASDPIYLMTALHLAAQNDHVEVCRELIAREAKPNTTDSFGTNALHWAALKGYVDVCRALIEGGADVDASVLSNGMNALHCAADKGHVEVCRALIVAGADLKALNSNGMSAIHLAAVNGHVGVCEVAFSKLNAQDIFELFKQISQTYELGNFNKQILDLIKTHIGEQLYQKLINNENKSAPDSLHVRKSFLISQPSSEALPSEKNLPSKEPEETPSQHTPKKK